MDIENAAIAGIVPLGFKDFSKGQPNLTTYEISDRGAITNGGEALLTATGETIDLGGFSGLWYDGVADNGNLQFLAVPDRGPNGDVTDGNRPFLLPDYQARIVSLEVNEATGDVIITNELLLTRPDGTPITGLPNIPGVDERAVDAAGEFVDLDFLDGFEQFGTDYDPLGADLEGIVRAGDGTYWAVDEYRPAIYRFDTDGTLISRFIAEGTVVAANAANPGANFAPGTFGTETLPAEYLNRRPNRGFEAMALDSENGILYAFIQTPLSNPDRDTGDNSSVIRMLGIDPTTGEPVAEYVYLLQKPDVGGNVDKIGDAVYAGDGKFFVMERDSSLASTAQKFIFEVDLKGATNVLEMDLGDATLEQQTPDNLAAMGVTPVNKVKVTNLPSIGYLPSDKPEGLALLPDGRLAVLNDNDFGLVEGAEAVELGLIDFATGNTLDASNEDGAIDLQNRPVFGTFQPDSIASFEVDGITYYATANEGDARIRPDGDIEAEDGTVITPEGEFFNEEARIKDVVLDAEVFPDAATLQADENLGRLNITTALGDLDGDGDLDQLVSYGARSFSIWDENGNLVYDSSDDIAKITATLTPELFNANDGDPAEFDQRSDDKGAEPEALTIGTIGDQTFAFVGLERAGGGVLVYDITNPLEAQFVQYLRDDADIAPEGLSFIASEDSPNGRNLLVVANEESSTLAIYADNEGNGGGGTGGRTDSTAIFDIQGAAHQSPLLGETVTTTGIVTAVDNNGFYLQDAVGDGDLATSDALFVFTGDEPSLVVGDELRVTGTVSEFTPGGTDTGNLSATQLSGDVTVEVLSSGNELPAAVVIGAGGRIPPSETIDDDAFASFDPDTDGIDFFESLEAMRVTAQDAIAVAGTNRFGEIFAVVDGGADATGLSDRGTLNISPDDFNPEKIQIDADSTVSGFSIPLVDTGAVLGDVTGVIGYDFGNFQIIPTEEFGAETWDVDYSGWWDAAGGGTLSGTLLTTASAADDGVLTPEELLGWEWDWSGNDDVAAFLITSEDAGAEIQSFGPTGFRVDGSPNLPGDADDLEQGVFVGGESGEFVLDLEFLTIEDNSMTFPLPGDVTTGDLPDTSREVAVTDAVWAIEYSGWWDAAGGGTLSGTLFSEGTAADDGILTPEELLAWEWNWSGNDDVAAFAITSSDPGAAIQSFGLTGFYVDGTPNLPNLADELEQGVFLGGESGEFVLDLEFLTVEDNSETFPASGGDFTVGDLTTATGEIGFSEVSWQIEYSGWWETAGGGTLAGSLLTDATAAADGILMPEELLAWTWDWSGNEEVEAFVMTSDDAGAEIQSFGSTGFWVDGTPNLPGDADDLDQGVFVGGESGELVLDLDFLAVEDNSESFPLTSAATVGDVEPVGAVTISESGASLQPESTALVGGTNTLTVASYNVLNLDPNDADGDSDVENGRFAAIAQQIVNNLNTPDILGLQEIQDNSGADDDGTTAADETLQLLVDEIAAAGGPQYEFIDNSFITDGASGGQPGGNIRNAFLYNPETVDLADGSVQPVGDQAAGSPFAGARLPLAATFEFNGEAVTIVNNHFSSKGGSAPILGVEQPFDQRQEEPEVNGSLNERRVQAQAVNDFVDDLFAEDTDANVIVLGDLNEFEFVSPLDILAGTVESTADGFGIAATGEDAVLNNLVNTVDPDERYSFIFQGNSQVLDHILVSDSLFADAEFDIVHTNVEFAATDGRASDHEPLVASFDFSGRGGSGGNGSNGEPVSTLLDLTGFDGDLLANVTLSREAAFDNILQFYETDAQGAIAGLLPGEAGYEDAVRENLIAGLELFVDNLVTTDTDIFISGGTYYAPALLVDGDAQNLVTIDDGVVGISRIVREENVWSFEDLTDFDFDDFVLTLNSAEAATVA